MAMTCGTASSSPGSSTGVVLLLLLLAFSLAPPLLVCAEKLLSVAVALPSNSTTLSDFGTSELNIGNDSRDDTTVFWVQVNPFHPFQVTQLLNKLDRQDVHLLLLPDDVAARITRSPGFIPSPNNLTLVTFAPREVAEETSQADEELPADSFCLDLPRDGLPEHCSQQHLVTCDRSAVAVTMVHAVVTVLGRLQWTDVLLLHDDDHEMAAKELSDGLSTDLRHTQLIQYSFNRLLKGGNTSGLSESEALHQAVQGMYERREGQLRVVLLCSLHCAKQVLTAASKFDALNGRKTAVEIFSSWLLVLPPSDQHVIESCDLQLDNVAVIIHPPQPTVTVVKDIHNEIEDILRSVHSSLVEANVTATAASMSGAVKQRLNPHECYSSPIKTLLWKPEGRRLSHVGYVWHDGQLVTGVGEQARVDGDLEVFPNIKFGFNDRKFLVGTLPWPSFIERLPNGSYEGLCLDLLHELQAVLNFSVVWTEPADQQYGALDENDTWTGLVGMLARKEVDMVVAPLTVQADRELVMDFTYPFYVDYTTVLIGMPNPDKRKWFTLIQPFSSRVHMFIWISLLVVTLLTHIMECYNPYYATNTKSMVNIGDMFWYMFGALLTQGGARLPDSQTGRTMVSIFWLFSIVMAAIYSGNLIAFLTVSKETAPFETLEGLIHQDEYSWGMSGGTSFITLFKSTSDPVYQKVWAGIEEKRYDDPGILSADLKDHLDKVKAGEYAFIAGISTINTWLKTECDLLKIREQFLPMTYAFGLINNSAYNEMFSEKVLKIGEVGLLERWERRWWGKKSFCAGSVTTSATPIQLMDVQSAFFLIFIGVTVAFLVLLFERLSHRFHLATRLKEFFCKNKQRRTTRNVAGGGRGGGGGGGGGTGSSPPSSPTSVMFQNGVKVRARTSTFRRKIMMNNSGTTADHNSDPNPNPLGSEFNTEGMFYQRRCSNLVGFHCGRNNRGIWNRPLGKDLEANVDGGDGDKGTYYTYR